MSAVENDQKKRKRMLSNRESARRSRMRKQQHFDDLLNQMARFKEGNIQMMTEINLRNEKYERLDAENTLLRAQVMELTERLKSLNSMIWFVETASGLSANIHDIPDPFLSSWKLPCMAQQLIALPHMFQC
ncbi:hypothetical protein HPP92_016359 [Vanilla planifolia]|uniref:BZIP domain-containing protein n=1 Tax=Vanilla planifolia TaxID=51239 RepID=A0A835QNI5_VANPL|nr:hypothetical protein HPP92_016359 [Vanilla planifolia]